MYALYVRARQTACWQCCALLLLLKTSEKILNVPRLVEAKTSRYPKQDIWEIDRKKAFQDFRSPVSLVLEMS